MVLESSATVPRDPRLALDQSQPVQWRRCAPLGPCAVRRVVNPRQLVRPSHHESKELEREVKDLHRAKGILKLASAVVAHVEFDRRFKS